MNLLEFAEKTSRELKETTDGTFAELFVKAKTHCFHTYQDGMVTSNSHGLEFFDNVIKYWNDPDSYYTPKNKNAKDDYEYNFVKILKSNIVKSINS